MPAETALERGERHVHEGRIRGVFCHPSQAPSDLRVGEDHVGVLQGERSVDGNVSLAAVLVAAVWKRGGGVDEEAVEEEKRAAEEEERAEPPGRWE